MIAQIYASIIQGVGTSLITIEAYMNNGIPQINVVGLADQTIREAKDRMLIAFQNVGIKLPNKKFVLSLNPTDLKKQGSHMDLPMALALLKASGILPESHIKIGALGAMNLSGDILETHQIFALIESLVINGCDLIFIPEECKSAIRFFPSSKIVPIGNLGSLVNILTQTDEMVMKTCEGLINREELLTDNTVMWKPYSKYEHLDYDQVKGQEVAKRAIMLAVGGKHHLLLYGPPGTGKTMLSSRIPTILEPLSKSYVYERLKLLSCAGQSLDYEVTQLETPFRSPHSGISLSAMLGGMQVHMLGEAVLAHRGILFLDEMPEYKRDVLEGLRGPLESGEIHLSKTHYKAVIPSKFTLIATANPCPCGYHGFSDRCNCNEREIQRYFSKLSGPLLDIFGHKLILLNIENIRLKFNCNNLIVVLNDSFNIGKWC